MYTKITKCRICENKNLITVIELGDQALTGVFPKDRSDVITSGPLSLVKCHGLDSCGLLQLEHSYSLDEMYGDNYGYRSGLNPSMVRHLESKVDRIEALGLISAGDLVVDIGSNDGTTLRQYKTPKLRLIGIDPTGVKFKEFYGESIELISDFFNAAVFQNKFGNLKAKVITSFSMFYDLEDPLQFMREIESILDKDGIWVFEQSYMPTMLATNSYDTICHEHLEYYSLAQIQWMAIRAGLEIVDVHLNDVNGGSFSITAQKIGGRLPISHSVTALSDDEKMQHLDDIQTYFDFGVRIEESKKEILEFFHYAKSKGKKVVGLGASTKGNVLLQYCKIDEGMLHYIGEVNPFKFGSYTPGTLIPIVDEKNILDERPDYILVLPWHFRAFFDQQERYKGLNLVYPLPVLSVSLDE